MAKKKPSPTPRSADMARKIWLAGIGAYGRAFSEAQESIAKVSGDSARMFDDLVAKGEEIEDTVEEHGRDLAKRVKSRDFNVDERIRKMRARLNLGETPREDRLDAIEARLVSIEEKLDAALGDTTPKRQAAKSAKKASTKKRSS